MRSIRQINKKSLLLIIFSLVLYNCNDDLLDEAIDNRTLIKRLPEMEKFVAGLIPRADYMFTDYMTDDYVFVDLAGHSVQNVEADIRKYFQFEVTNISIASNQYNKFDYSNPNLAWVRYYYRIQNSSLAIESAVEYETETKKEKKLKDHIISQAKAIRAYCTFMLLNLFAVPYNETSADKDLGVPLVESYTGKAIETYPRKSLKEEYDFIEKELIEALSLVDDKAIEHPQFAMTTTNMQALLSKVYLYKKDWDKAIAYATKVIRTNANLLDIKTLTDIYLVKRQKEFSTIGKEYFDPSAQKSYLLVSENTQIWQSYFWTGYYLYPLARFFMQNGRTIPMSNPFIRTSPLFNDIIPIKMVYFLNSPSGRNTIQVPLLSVDELYYIRAEASIEKGNLNKAKEDLTLLISKEFFDNDTFIDRLSGISGKKDLMKYLLDAKRMRFFGEGMRWFDMRRHGIPVTHITDRTFTIDGTEPKKYVIKPPSEEIDFGGNEYEKNQ